DIRAAQWRPFQVGEWLSLVEHLVRDQGVGGSNPLSPTNSPFCYSRNLQLCEPEPNLPAAGFLRHAPRKRLRCRQHLTRLPPDLLLLLLLLPRNPRRTRFPTHRAGNRQRRGGRV